MADIAAPIMGVLKIRHDGDTWSILSEGAFRDGKVLCHLASSTRFTQQRNGSLPVQIVDWIDARVILSAAILRDESARGAIAHFHEDAGEATRR